MSRREQWEQVKQSMLGQAMNPNAMKEMENIPDKACGLCKNFSENAYASDGRGYCNVLKFGSDIAKQPPVYVTKGEIGLVTFFNTDASRCRYFDRMKLVDTDGTECADPAYRRAQRQMEKFNK
ncbi:MAG: hypothetical protein FJY85_19535 [Deltaproteobacteria bacterium]|nr:hypothetical protein [Deltaproteobacteria bacterium]